MSQPTVNSDATNQTDVPVEEVDLLVVGGGKAGKSLAMLRAKAGDKVVMVERDKVGGTCINVACIPTKTLISAARVLREVQGSQAYGVTLPEQDGGADALAQARIELASFRARKEAVVGGMVAAHEKMFPASGMDFVKGTARFVGERTVEIALNDGGLRRVRGAKVLINTGTTPSVPRSRACLTCATGPARTCSPCPSCPVASSSWAAVSSASRWPPSWGSSESRSPSSTLGRTSWTARTRTSPLR